MKKQIVEQLESKRRQITAMRPSPSDHIAMITSPLRKTQTPSPPVSVPFKTAEQVSSASPLQFSHLQLQSILQKGKTVRKLTEMRDIIRNEGWRSVASRPGEYQILVKTDSPL